MNKVMELPMNWPVEVNNLEASAFCEWKSAKENIKLRLPSESEYFALRNFIQEDQPDWKPKSVGNINL